MKKNIYKNRVAKIFMNIDLLGEFLYTISSKISEMGSLAKHFGKYIDNVCKRPSHGQDFFYIV